MNPSSAIGRTQSLHSSPDRNQTNQTLPIQIASALESALPGVNASKLVHALDTLLGGRGNYTLVGSAAMHLHALEHPNATCKLPLPHDLDVVVNDTAIRRVELANPETLGKLNLKRDANFAHVLHMTRENAPNLKIDIVRSSTPGFLKYQFNPHSIHNIQVGMLADCLADYKATYRSGIRRTMWRPNPGKCKGSTLAGLFRPVSPRGRHCVAAASREKTIYRIKELKPRTRVG